MEGHLVMSAKERKRMLVFERVKEKQLNMADAVKRLELSYRQVLRSYKRYVEDGAEGLVHRSRGRPSNRTKPREFRQKILDRYCERYKDFGPTLAQEKLEKEGLKIDHETLRRWLISEGLWEKRRKRRKHRKWRERKSHFGELVQLDGSHHQWFGKDRESACLMNMVDDATGKTLSFMAEEETTEAAMRILRRWIELHGVPKALYADRKNVYITDREPTLEEELRGEEPLTVFGKACNKLGIEIITAFSPQAKGRVERNHGVYQDRFVKELFLEGITTIAGANKLLWSSFARSLNAKFAVSARDPQDFHRPFPKDISPDEVFCFEETRVLQNDWTIRFQNELFQVPRNNRPLPKPRDKVLIRKLLDGTIEIVYRGKRLDFERIDRADIVRTLAARLGKAKVEPIKLVIAIKRSAKVARKRPSLGHPWRRGYKPRLASVKG
jgi:transposase